jgi:cytochrome P450
VPTGAIDFDPFSATFFDDPYDTYARLRDEAPVYVNETYGFYAVSRYADVVALHADPQRLVSSYGVTLEMLRQHQPLDANMMIMMDPPEHTRHRRLVSQAFSRRAIGDLEPLVAGVIDGLLDGLVGRRQFDLVADFAALFPVEVISSMLGVPPGERQQIRLWVDTLLHREEGSPDTTHEGMEAALYMAGYFLDLSKAKRAEPDGLLMTRLIEAELDDENGEPYRLSDEEVASFAALIASAGSETVTKLVGSAVVLFDENPDQWDLVRADAAAISGAVEEVLRMHPPSQYQGRYAVEPVTLEGGTIPADTPVLLLTGAATRDPREYENPDAFDITRGGRTTLAFGYGVHGCLGAWLARMESQLALNGIRRRWPDFTVERDGLVRVNMSNVAGFSHVPVTVPA